METMTVSMILIAALSICLGVLLFQLIQRNHQQIITQKSFEEAMNHMKAQYEEKMDQLKKEKSDEIEALRMKCEEEIRCEKEKVEFHKQSLMQLSEKEILAKIVAALETYEARISRIEKEVNNDAIAMMESAISNIECQVGNIRLSVDEISSTANTTKGELEDLKSTVEYHYLMEDT